MRRADITPTHSELKLQDLQLNSEENDISRTEMGVQTLIPVTGMSPNLHSNPSFGDYRDEPSELQGVENLDEEEDARGRERFNNSNESLVRVRLMSRIIQAFWMSSESKISSRLNVRFRAKLAIWLASYRT